MKRIFGAYEELRDLNKGFVYSVAQINWWLLKHRELYKNTVENQEKLCAICEELEKEDLPYDCIIKPDYCNKNIDNELFISFYNELDKATELHELEKLCLIAYNEYVNIKSINAELRDWVIKNYNIYEELRTYFYSYLEFNSKNDKKLYIVESPDKSFGVSIQEEDYINSLKFYDVYYDLYENQKLYPEKIKERDDFFQNEIPR